MNNQYWDTFYQDFKMIEPSDFAKSLNFNNKTILDIGCGNGRDTIFFNTTNNLALGIDEFPPDKYGFLKTTIEEFIKYDIEYNILYMRFLLHAIDEDLENNIIHWASKNSNELYIECRSDKGDVPDNTHTRRLINAEKLKLKIISAGFDIKYFAESTGFAPYKDEDPVIIRLVAKK